jgi:D-3-phosphoglycerate dehydrogenase / 2-oxoglutarate reductase
MARVLLTQAILPRAQALLARSAEVVVAADTRAETLRRAAQGCEVIVVRAPLPDDIFAVAPTLIGAVRHGAGVDMIPIDAASAHGVLVANVPGVNAVSVAEHVLGQMIRLARRGSLMSARLRRCDDRSWPEARELADGGFELAGRTLGLIGHGHVGRAIARICAQGFAMTVLTHTRSAPAAGPVQAVSLTELLERSDFVVLACPLTDQTRGLIGAGQLAAMRRGAFLINVARGPVVNEAALIEALRSGHLAGAALDVFDAQPLPVVHPFWSMDQVLLTPHVAGISQDSMWRMGQAVASAVSALLAGEIPPHCINPEAAPAFRVRFGNASTGP